VTFKDLTDRCVLPLRFKVCGMRLRPLTIGHLALLEALEVKLPDTLPDLWLAAVVCSKPSRVFLRRLSLPGLIVRTWFSYERMRFYRFEREAAKWADYLVHNTEPPEVVLTGKLNRCTTPWLQHLRTILLAKLGYRPVDIDDTPYAQALWDYYGWLEAEGGGRVMPFSPSERTELVAAATAGIN
jgi:hypothetical protein